MGSTKQATIGPQSEWARHRIGMSSWWNLVGQVAVGASALLAIPVLIKAIGNERFGLLSLVWMVVGYFGLLDFGLGRALTQTVSRSIALGENAKVYELFWTSIVLMLSISCVGAFLVVGSMPLLVDTVARIPSLLRHEAIVCMLIVCACIPVVTCTAGLTGFLAAHGRFGMINAVRIPAGILSYAGLLPLLTLSRSLVVIVAFTCAVRIIACLLYCLCCERAAPGLWRDMCVDRSLSMTLLRHGGWMTVTNVVGPLMTYVDRFFISAALGLSAVSFYTTPYEIVTKLWVVSGALISVLLPALAHAAARDWDGAIHLYRRASWTLVAALGMAAVPFILFPSELLRIWIGEEYSLKSATVMQLLTMGVLIHGVAQMPFIFLQSMGRADVAAKLQIAQLHVYAGLLWALLRLKDIEGAAAAWLLRIVLDAGLMAYAVRKVSEMTFRFVFAPLGACAGIIIIMALASVPGGILLRMVSALLIAVLFGIVGWKLVLYETGRAAIRIRCLRALSFFKLQ